MQPWASGYAVMEAYLVRAKGLLENGRILSGRKQGVLYSEPVPRTEEQWRKVFELTPNPTRRSRRIQGTPATETVESAQSDSGCDPANAEQHLLIEVTVGNVSPWVAVRSDDDNHELWNGRMAPEEKKSFVARKSFWVRTNESVALRFTFNGHARDMGNSYGAWADAIFSCP